MARVKYISATQAAGLAKVDRRTVLNWCADSKFACNKIGSVWVVDEKSFLEFLSARLILK
jgi:hypothetical protein